LALKRGFLNNPFLNRKGESTEMALKRGLRILVVFISWPLKEDS
jgi:hypothetical protein